MAKPLTFGKFRGVPLKDVPHWYLRWALANVSLPAKVQSAVQCLLSGQLPDTNGNYYEPETSGIYQGSIGEIEARLMEVDIPY